jgi:aminocarboxymuconate-semialdehyde decarboxylase
MLFKCLPEGSRIPGRFPGPAHARGKWFTIDIHCHVTSLKAAAMVDGNTDVSRWFLETQANPRSQDINRQNGVRTRQQGTSAEQRIADMDLMGIDIQAISPAPRQTYYGADPELGLATARTLNDEIADIVGRHPDRFTGLGTIPLQAPELAIAELERLHHSLGMRGIEIMTHVAGEDLSEDRFRPVFRRIEELGLLVFMHPDGFTEARRFKDHYFANVIGNPFDTTMALHHLIFDGVLERYPNLKIIAAHGGGYLPAYSGRIDHGWGARSDAHGDLPQPPSFYLKKI